MTSLLGLFDRRGSAFLAAGAGLTLIAVLAALILNSIAISLVLLSLVVLRTGSALHSLATARRLAERPSGRAWRFIGTGWLLAAASTTLLLASLGLRGSLPPTPSLAELLLLAAYCSALWAFASYSSFVQEGFGRLRAFLDVAILIISVLGLTWLVLAEPVVAARIAESVPVFWAVIWPALNLCSLILVFRLSLLAQPGPERSAMVLLGLAAVVAIVGNLAAGFYLLTGEPTPTSRLLSISMVGALLASRAAIDAGQMPERAAVPGRPRTRPASIESLLPLTFTYLVVGYTAVDAWLQGSIDQLGLGMSIALTLMLFARQGVVAGQSEMRQYAALVDGSADMAFICQPTGRIGFSSPSFAAALRRSLPKMAGLQLQDILDRGFDPRQILDQGARGGWEGEVSFHRSDGSTFPARLSLRPVVLERQRRPVLAASAVDLTQIMEREGLLRSALDDVAAARTELEGLNRDLEAKVDARTQELQLMVEDLDRLNRELLELDRLKNEFVSLVSHELRAPLTNIRAGVELLLPEGAGLPPGAHDSLRLILAETERLGGFVDAILDLSALEAGRFPLSLEPLDLRNEALAAVDRFRAFDDFGRILVRLDPGLPRVLADERALASVLYYLLDNAVKYAPAGEVLVAAEAREDRLIGFVSDRGPGIPESERERVFDMFHRLDSSDSQEVYGHGLGLHLVRRLLEAMGGGVRAEAGEAGGARMVFWLPVVEAVDEPMAGSATAGSGAHG